ncbi:hypothetical protein LUZ60_001378 [Juncus effusus]|nr:hypothetical protein LUZ60_001378 [Juncus effusus]
MNPTDMAIGIISLISLLVLFLIPSTLSSKLSPSKITNAAFSLVSSSQYTSELQQVDIGPRLVNIEVGKQQISAIMDINNDLIWAICVPSNNTSPFYNPSNSSTFTNISCGACPTFVNQKCSEQCQYYNNTDIDTWATYGYLVRDNISVGANSNSTEISFGCVYNDSSTTVYSMDYFYDTIYGVLGFGNGNLSLAGQLGYQRFSYCLSANATEATTVKFNSSAVITGKESQSIKLITYPDAGPYYFNLTQITVGTTPVTLNTSMVYYTIMDTYLPYIFLDDALYNSTRDAFLDEVGLSIGESNETEPYICFNKALTMPSLELQFDGSVNVTLETSAYIVKHPNASKKCLSIYPIGDDMGYNILGNLMQVDMNMVFDLEKKILSFEKTKCTSSAKTFTLSGTLSLVVLLFSFLVI